MAPAPLARSIDAAVVVDDLWAEYVWLEQHQPDWVVVQHGVARKGDKTFDVLRLQSPDGETTDTYFDISELAGFKAQPTTPCPHCGLPLVTARAMQCRSCFADFHDPDHVVYRKGRAHVDDVRSGAVEWSDSGTPLELRDPFEAFTTRFRLTRAAGDIVMLRRPAQRRAHDARLFRIGIACLHAKGCRGVVFDLRHSTRHFRIEPGSVSDTIAVPLVADLREAPMRVVLLRGHGVPRRQLLGEGLENYDTEDEALARLTSYLEGAGT